MTDHKKEKRIGVRLSEAHVNKLDKITTITRLTISQFFRQVIEDYKLRNKG